jgi:hypothetical protein
MRLFSYVVARDYGFAPNPFFNECTLATCKPRIRSVAKVGDWVVGTGSSEQHRTGFLVYAMHVTETMSFNQYWADERFQQKKPNLQGSKKQAYNGFETLRSASCELFENLGGKKYRVNFA